MAHAGPALLALLVFGCSHAEPFAVSDPSEEGPFAAGAVVRLTYGDDVSPAAWLPGGDTVLLSGRDGDRREGDVCLFLLPASGGTRTGAYCSASYQQSDSIERFGAPAVSAERDVAFSYRHQRAGGSTFGSISSATLASPFTPTELASLPFSLDGRVIQDATDLGWQPDGSLTFLAWTDEVLERDCSGIPCDILLRIPLGAVRVSAGGGGVAALGGTRLATSMTPDGNGGLFTTFPGSDQLWQVSAGGDSVAVHDFGPGSGVRGADHRAGKVAVILGGSWSVEADDFGLLPTEMGFGELGVLDLATGTVTLVGPADMLFRDPALSLDGRSAVAIGSHFTVIPRTPTASDTALARPQGDLWRIDLP